MLDKVSLSRLTLKDVREYLKTKNRIIIPVGSTEEHGEHLPYTVDVDIPTEVAIKVAKKIEALVASPLYYGCSQTMAGMPGSAWLRAETFGRVIEDISVSFAESGFKRIIWLNGHYANDPALFIACTDITGTRKVPKDAKVFGLTYWLPLPEKVLNKYLSWESGWHAQVGETSMMLAINPDVVKMENAPVEWPNLPRSSVILNALFQGTGSVKCLMKTGVWGDARDATKEKGEKFLSEVVESVAKAIEDIELAFQEMESKN